MHQIKASYCILVFLRPQQIATFKLLPALVPCFRVKVISLWCHCDWKTGAKWISGKFGCRSDSVCVHEFFCKWLVWLQRQKWKNPWVNHGGVHTWPWTLWCQQSVTQADVFCHDVMLYGIMLIRCYCIYVKMIQDATACRSTCWLNKGVLSRKYWKSGWKQ